MSRNAAQPGVAADELLAVARTSQLNASIVRRTSPQGVPMAENKTKATEASVESYLSAIEDEAKRNDCKALTKLMT